jgi:hypothetical protein
MEIETAGCVSDVCMVLAENVRVCVCVAHGLRTIAVYPNRKVKSMLRIACSVSLGAKRSAFAWR